MNINKDACDNCNKETKDRYTHRGWIEISSLTGKFSISISRHRDENRAAKTGYINTNRLDFCCQSCLIEYLDELAEADAHKRIKPKHGKVFSGDSSKDMWDAINSAMTKEDLGAALYFVCCKIQDLEAKFDKQLEIK